MALTNFAALTDEQLTAWSRKFWRHMRNREFLTRFAGEGEGSMIQKIPELTKTSKGARAVMTLIADSKGDGKAGDRQLEGNEEALSSSDIVIQIDQLRHAHINKGRMAEQKSVVKFRKEALNNLSYWLSDRRNQMAFLTLMGVSYAYNTDGSSRVGSDLPLLEFASDVSAPTANRYFRYDATNGLVKNGSNADLVAADKLTWGAIVDMKTELETAKIKPVSTEDGLQFYNVFLHPKVMNALKKDSDFLAAMRYAMPRSEMNPLFKGTDTIMLDGLAITPYHHAFNTLGAASGSKWGGGAVDGGRIAFCGAQALGFADIGNPLWVEKEFDYENRPGISVGKIQGFRKPVFEDPTTSTDEDFSVMCLDVAI